MGGTKWMRDQGEATRWGLTRKRQETTSDKKNEDKEDDEGKERSKEGSQKAGTKEEGKGGGTTWERRRGTKRWKRRWKERIAKENSTAVVVFRPVSCLPPDKVEGTWVAARRQKKNRLRRPATNKASGQRYGVASVGRCERPKRLDQH